MSFCVCFFSCVTEAVAQSSSDFAIRANTGTVLSVKAARINIFILTMHQMIVCSVRGVAHTENPTGD